MLAQNFKTPVDLNMKDDEYEAHIKVLGMLERGELRHDPGRLLENGFNMGTCGDPTACGTVACIGGWVAFLLRKHQTDYVNGATGEREQLYYPHFHLPVYPQNVTTQQAAIALRNYLTFGEPRWAEALAE